MPPAVMPPAPAAVETEQARERGGLARAVDLAVIVPAYNERAGIDDTLTRLRATLASVGCTSEIIVVDDGSADGTGDRAAAAGVRVITHAENQGYGAALKTGVLATNAATVGIIDADGSYQPEAFRELYSHIGRAEMVVGARRLSSPAIPWMRRPAKWFLNHFASYLSGRRIPDVNSGQRIMRREVLLRYLHLLPDAFSFTSTATLAFFAGGHRVTYVPIEYAPRAGESKIRAVHFASFLLLVVRSVVLFNPLKIFLPLGALLFLVGLAKLVQDIARLNLSETAVMAFLAGIIVCAVGLLADMIARLQLRPPWHG